MTVVYHADVIETIPYLVIEYVDGPSLSELISRSGHFSPGAAVAVLDPVTQAISELHDKAIIHRDIKPSNILLDAHARVFVTDFGLACARPSAKHGASAPRLAGTPAYMAPEMFDGTVSPQSDVYALGIVSFELLTGRLPFTGSLEELRDEHLHQPLPLDALRERRVDSALIELVERATHKKAMFRFKRAEHFRRALRDTVATDELLTSGAAELQDIVFKLHERGTVDEATDKAKDPSTSTYFKRLSELADKKRAAPDPVGQLEGSVREPVSSAPISCDHPTRAATIAVDVSCVQCSYNLRELPGGGRCPECGEAAASSLRRDRLLFANPKWLSAVALGQTAMLASMIADAVFPIVLAMMLGLFAGTKSGASDVYAEIVLAFEVLVNVVGAKGVFMSTQREPGLSVPKHTVAICWIARACALLDILVIAADIPVSFPVGRVNDPSMTRMPLGVSVVVLVSGVIGLLSLLRYLGTLAERVPDAKLLRSSRQLSILACVIVPAGLVFRAFTAVSASGGAVADAPLMSWLTAASGILFFVLVFATGLLCGCLFFAYRRALKRVIAATVSYDTLFGDIPAKAAFPSAE